MAPCVELATGEDILACCRPDQYDEEHPPSDDQVAYAVEVASFIAWALSGRRHGVCEVQGERPGRLAEPLQRCVTAGRGVGCRCHTAPVVTLGNAPVVTVDEVRIGGTALDPAEYRLYGANRLLRLGAPWPTHRLLDEPDDAPGVLVVDYTWGVPLTAAGRRAVARFGCEVMKACMGVKCQLPERTTSIVRQGISIDILDPMDFLEDGRSGVYDLDQWLSAVNPGRLSGRSRVASPDVAEAVVLRSSGAGP